MSSCVCAYGLWECCSSRHTQTCEYMYVWTHPACSMPVAPAAHLSLCCQSICLSATQTRHRSCLLCCPRRLWQTHPEKHTHTHTHTHTHKHHQNTLGNKANKYKQAHHNELNSSGSFVWIHWSDLLRAGWFGASIKTLCLATVSANALVPEHSLSFFLVTLSSLYFYCNAGSNGGRPRRLPHTFNFIFE